MGSKHASVHLRCEDSAGVLAKLQQEFDSKKGPDKENLVAIEIIKDVASKKIDTIENPIEKAEKTESLNQIVEIALKNMSASEPMVIVVRKHFISLYWYDHIRNDNLQRETIKYAALCNVPAMGVGIFDDANFTICAVDKAEERNTCSCLGEYFFEHDYISPVKAEDICSVIGAPFLQESLRRTLSCDDGNSMVNCFEKEVGFPILMDADNCREIGMKELYCWENVIIYLEN